MQIVHAWDAQEISTPHKISSRKLMAYEHALVVMLDLKPHETLLPHITPVDVFFYILDGEGEVKMQVGPRSYTKKDGTKKATKAGRLTIDDVLWLGDIIDEVKDKMNEYFLEDSTD